MQVVYRSLEKHGFSVGALHGDLDQRSRMAALDAFRNDQVQLLVCSDVAARGLDIPDVSHVINYDAPHHAEDYVHRIGRTGRAGKLGAALTIVTRADARAIEDIEKLIAPQDRLAGRRRRRASTRRRKAPPSAASIAAREGADAEASPDRPPITGAAAPAPLRTPKTPRASRVRANAIPASRIPASRARRSAPSGRPRRGGPPLKAARRRRAGRAATRRRRRRSSGSAITSRASCLRPVRLPPAKAVPAEAED